MMHNRRINFKKLKSRLIPIACGVIMICLFRFIFFIGFVPSASMEPTVQKNSYVLGIRFYGELKRGDVIFFIRDGQTYLKRIAAIPGDTVYIDDTSKSISVNTELKTATRILTIPGGCFFVMGDNANDSVDSRYWGNPLVREEEVIARVF